MAKTEKMAKTANPENQENREQKLPSLRVYLMLLHNILNQNMVNMYAQLMEVYSIKYMMKLDKIAPKSSSKRHAGYQMRKKLTLPMKNGEFIVPKEDLPENTKT